MTKLGRVLFLFALLSLTLFVLSSNALTETKDEPTETPLSDKDSELQQGLAPKPSYDGISGLTEEEKKAYRCASLMGHKCAEEVYEWVVLGDQVNGVSDACCKKLGSVGIDCHKTCLSFVLKEEKEIIQNPTSVISRAEKLWLRCGLDEGSSAPSPIIG